MTYLSGVNIFLNSQTIVFYISYLVIFMQQSHILLQRKHWIFDLDGTLTVAVHDFDAIRNELGIQEGMPIIKTLKSLPKKKSVPLQKKLNEIEKKLAENSILAPGVRILLEFLSKRNYKLGILTLNTKENALITLYSLGLTKFFNKELVLGRWCTEPKPSPKGIFKILQHWKVKASDALIVGDYLYDLQVGRAAKIATIHVDPKGDFFWPELADIKVKSLSELVKILNK